MTMGTRKIALAMEPRAGWCCKLLIQLFLFLFYQPNKTFPIYGGWYNYVDNRDWNYVDNRDWNYVDNFIKASL
jgi:hypothetical protein